MTPSDTTAMRRTDRQLPEDDLAMLIAACGRDERPALQSLYRQTAGTLYGLALAAADDRADADRALVQTYLEAFGEAASFAADRDTPIAWLTERLARQLPAVQKLGKPVAIKPTEPPAELWQKLDIGLGLKRLDRHIKPGVATQPRGRDPMPNAYDRRVERQVRFWRTTTLAGGAVAALAIGAILMLGQERGPAGLLAGPRATTTLPAAGPPATGEAVPQAASVAATDADPAASPATPAAATDAWRAILQPAAGSRLWQVQRADDRLEVTAMPPFALAEAAGKRVLVLWAASPGEELRHLGTLDPARMTALALPAVPEARALRFVVSLEPAAAAAGEAPSGPLLFAGGSRP